MKISFFLPSLNIGGIERVFLTYANALCDKNHVEFVLCKKEGLLIKQLSTAINVVNLGDIKLSKSFFALRRYINKNRPDCIVSGGDYPNIMLILSSRLLRNRPRIIISQHNYINIEVQKLGAWAKLTPIWIRLSYSFSDRIIAVSKGIQDYLINDLKQSSKKVVHLPNPIDIDEINEKSKRHIVIGFPENYLIFVGRLSVVKNLSLLLLAFDQLKIENCKLLVFGSGSEEKQMKEFASTLSKGKDIVFCGETSNPLPFIRNARVLILPSFSEAFPTILLESMCLNTPIVATPTKGAIEILSGVEGVYISEDFENNICFAQLIEQAYNQSMVSLQNHVQKYDKPIIVERFVSLCKSNK